VEPPSYLRERGVVLFALHLIDGGEGGAGPLTGIDVTTSGVEVAGHLEQDEVEDGHDGSLLALFLAHRCLIQRPLIRYLKRYFLEKPLPS